MAMSPYWQAVDTLVSNGQFRPKNISADIIMHFVRSGLPQDAVDSFKEEGVEMVLNKMSRVDASTNVSVKMAYLLFRILHVNFELEKLCSKGVNCDGLQAAFLNLTQSASVCSVSAHELYEQRLSSAVSNDYRAYIESHNVLCSALVQELRDNNGKIVNDVFELYLEFVKKRQQFFKLYMSQLLGVYGDVSKSQEFFNSFNTTSLLEIELSTKPQQRDILHDSMPVRGVERKLSPTSVAEINIKKKPEQHTHKTQTLLSRSGIFLNSKDARESSPTSVANIIGRDIKRPSDAKAMRAHGTFSASARQEPPVMANVVEATEVAVATAVPFDYTNYLQDLVRQGVVTINDPSRIVGLNNAPTPGRR